MTNPVPHPSCNLCWEWLEPAIEKLPPGERNHETSVNCFLRTCHEPTRCLDRRGDPRHYIATAQRNLRRKRRARLPVVAHPNLAAVAEVEMPPDAPAIRRELSGRRWSFIRGVVAPRRLVVLQARLDGQSHASIASEMGISENASQQLVSKALAKASAYLDEYRARQGRGTLAGGQLAGYAHLLLEPARRLYVFASDREGGLRLYPDGHLRGAVLVDWKGERPTGRRAFISVADGAIESTPFTLPDPDADGKVRFPLDVDIGLGALCEGVRSLSWPAALTALHVVPG